MEAKFVILFWHEFVIFNQSFQIHAFIYIFFYKYPINIQCTMSIIHTKENHIKINMHLFLEL